MTSYTSQPTQRTNTPLTILRPRQPERIPRPHRRELLLIPPKTPLDHPIDIERLRGGPDHDVQPLPCGVAGEVVAEGGHVGAGVDRLALVAGAVDEGAVEVEDEQLSALGRGGAAGGLFVGELQVVRRRCPWRLWRRWRRRSGVWHPGLVSAG